MNDRLFNFIGGNGGSWIVESMTVCTGEPIRTVSAINILQGELNSLSPTDHWVLKGFTSNERYVERSEKELLNQVKPILGRPESTLAALIPIRKSAAWWELAQDERREILEAKSSHIETGLRYLPAIARRLHHCRDIGERFDFLTWFEYSPADVSAFDDLVNTLRQTEEWKYVDREVDIRLSRS